MGLLRVSWTCVSNVSGRKEWKGIVNFISELEWERPLKLKNRQVHVLRSAIRMEFFNYNMVAFRESPTHNDLS